MSSDGSVDWLCLSRLDDGSYFGRLLEPAPRPPRDPRRLREQDGGPAGLDRRLAQTVAWWRGWSAHGDRLGHDGPALVRSATVLKALNQTATGAIAAAATTNISTTSTGSCWT